MVEHEGRIRGIPRSIWALGLVSLLMDVSSEMIHGLMPVFLVTVLGASAVTVGLIEGIGEATANVMKLLSGVLSDKMGQRKPLTVLGYGLSALSKPVFAIAPTASWVLGARFADRVGKGVRGAPRDALVGDLAPSDMRGAAYGLRQSLDNVGAFLGPLLGIALMVAFSESFRAVFWVAAIPASLAVLVLIVAVREPPPIAASEPDRNPIDWRSLGRLGTVFWKVVGLGAVLTLARFSEAFVILRAEERGLTLALAPLVLVVIHVFSAASAYPAGALSDRMEKRGLLVLGFLALVVADVFLASAVGLTAIFAGAAFWGLHLGLTQGLLATMVADNAPPEARATAFGVFNLASGAALFLASLLAGALWEWLGPAATFWAGAGFAALGLAGFLLVGRSGQH